MANDFFRFKQFLIQQEKCAMKVCTDACLFGAWAAEKIKDLKSADCLDIGTGTGLLSLMLAQKNKHIYIDAPEIDASAFEQASGNFSGSVFKERLKAAHTSVQQFSSSTQKKYDLIIANPPFYENDLKSASAQRNLALHSGQLTLAELVAAAKHLLKKEGSFLLLMPFKRFSYTKQLLEENNFFISEEVCVRQQPAANFFRVMLWAETKPATAQRGEMSIKTGEDTYTPEFINLLKDYYLHL